MTDLTHLNADGCAHMVDVSAKPVTAREATARGRVLMSRATLDAIVSGAVPKGDVFATARIAGILAAKRTPVGKFGGSLARTSAPDLGAIAIKAVLDSAPIRRLADVVIGRTRAFDIQLSGGQDSDRQGLQHPGRGR